MELNHLPELPALEYTDTIKRGRDGNERVVNEVTRESYFARIETIADFLRMLGEGSRVRYEQYVGYTRRYGLWQQHHAESLTSNQLAARYLEWPMLVMSREEVEAQFGASTRAR